MADEEQDPLSIVADDCRYSSSQEELLVHAKFARADETFPDNDDSPAVEDSGVSRRKLDGEDDSGGIRGGELGAGDADSARAENLGFRGERKGEASGTKLEGFCGGEREIEPELKKFKVSPLVHCSGKIVIEGEDDGEEVVEFSGDLKVQKVCSLRSVVPESGECTEKLDSEDGGDDVRVEGEMRTQSGTKKKLEFGLETKEINIEEEGEIGEIGNVNKEGGDRGEGSGKVEEDEKQRDGMRKEEEEDITRREKRALPRSMFGLAWGEGTGDAIGNGDVEDGLKEARVEGKGDGESKGCEEEVDCGEGSGDANGNGVVGNGNVESGLKEASVKENKDGKCKGGEEATRCILDVLRMLVSEKCSEDDGEIDIFETAKRCGMTFPRSRFQPKVEEDE